MEILAPVEKQLAAYNNGDLDAYMACFAKDARAEDGHGNVLYDGWDAMREGYANLFASSPELHCELISCKVVGQFVLDEEHVTGRAGNDGVLHALAIYFVEDGLIRHVRFLK